MQWVSHEGERHMRAQVRTTAWKAVATVAIVAMALAAHAGVVGAEDATPIASADVATGQFTATIELGEDFDEGGELFGGQCLFVFDNISAEGASIGTVCDGGPDDQDDRDGVV